MPSEFEHLHDLRNELALAHLALVDFPAYQELGLDPNDFYSEFHARIVRLAEMTYEEYGRTDVPISRATNLGRDRDFITTEEGCYIISELSDPPLGVVADAEKLKRHRRERDLRASLLRAVKAVEQGNADEGMARVLEEMERAHARTDASSNVLSALDLKDQWDAEAQRLLAGDGISVGLPKLKQAVGPLFPGAVLVVGAATGNGKSSLVNEMILAAADDNTRAGLISMEDTNFVTVSRWLAGFGGVSARTLHRGQNLEHVGCGKAALSFAEYNNRIFVSECIGGTDQDVMARMSVMARRGAKLIVVDYIGEVAASIHQQDRRNEIRWLVKRLKAHALRIGVALVLVSQLSRPQKERAEGYEPNKHDLKEAGDVENAAEFIVLLWRSKEHDFAPVHLKLAKSKVGGMGARWEMQREVYSEDEYGRRGPGSARLREVVRERQHRDDYAFPLVVDDYEAALAQLTQR